MDQDSNEVCKVFSTITIDGTSANQEGRGGVIRENSGLAQWFIRVAQLVRTQARKTGDPGSNPGPGKQHKACQMVILK